jgi:hypothetical protein
MLTTHKNILLEAQQELQGQMVQQEQQEQTVLGGLLHQQQPQGGLAKEVGQAVEGV